MTDHDRNPCDAPSTGGPADEPWKGYPDPSLEADIKEADAAYAKGDVVRGLPAVRALRRIC
ncbi:hypothetical protein [Nakamurella alba]|uniref:hypothetical protein n=1 Tax=Nakamurella alba TaxID=2665158 RepID=UPI001E3DA134|nr:hypothetical protein [Nakamurella alba]